MTSSNNVKIIAIVAVSMLVVGGISAYFVLSDASSDSDSSLDYRNPYLRVLGNANGDADIGNDDVTYLEDLLSKGASLKDCPMADANNDGVLDSKDVEFLRTMIDGTATVLHYLNIDGKVCQYKISDKVNIVAVHRCVMRSMIMLTNTNTEDYRIVGVDSGTYKEVEFNRAGQYYSSAIDVGPANSSANHVEKINTLEKENGDLVVCLGSVNRYGTNLETNFDNDSHVQIVRLPSWEGDTKNGSLAMQGILTWGYLFDGIKGGSAWAQAQAYAKWASDYIDAIKDAVKDIPEDSRTKVFATYYSGSFGSSGNNIRGPGSGDYENILTAGGQNICTRFTSNERTAWVAEDLATYCKDCEVVFLMTDNLFTRNGEESDWASRAASEFAKIYNGYLPTSCAIYGTSWALNGASFPVQLIYYAKCMYPENKSMEGLSAETAWNEYLAMMGWDDRTDLDLSYDNLAISGGPAYTAKGI